MGTESGESTGAEIPAEPDLEPRRTVDALEQRINDEKAAEDTDDEQDEDSEDRNREDSDRQD